MLKICHSHIPGNKERTINNVSFEIKKGEIIALVGPNGAGKSTLVRLLCRLYDPDSGTVKYDGNNIRNIDPEEYRKRFQLYFRILCYTISLQGRISEWVILMNKSLMKK